MVALTRQHLTAVLIVVVLATALAAGCTLNVPSGTTDIVKAPGTTEKTGPPAGAAQQGAAGTTAEKPAAAGTTPTPAAGASQAAVVTTTTDTVTTTPTTTTSTVTTTPTPTCAVDFTGTPTSGAAPLTVTFTSLTTCDVDKRSWTFGDGSESIVEIGQSPQTHTYTKPGTYTVTLGENEHGAWADTEEKVGYITVTESPSACSADFVGTPTSGPAPLTVTFTSLTPCYVQKRTWNFGDGEVIGEMGNKVETHTYTKPGTYTVILVEKMSTGESDFNADTETKTAYVTVTAASGGTVNPDIVVKPPAGVTVNPDLFISSTPTVNPDIVAKPPGDVKVNPDLFITTTATPTVNANIVVKKPTDLVVNPGLIITTQTTLPSAEPISSVPQDAGGHSWF